MFPHPEAPVTKYSTRERRVHRGSHQSSNHSSNTLAVIGFPGTPGSSALYVVLVPDMLLSVPSHECVSVPSHTQGVICFVTVSSQVALK